MGLLEYLTPEALVLVVKEDGQAPGAWAKAMVSAIVRAGTRAIP